MSTSELQSLLAPVTGLVSKSDVGADLAAALEREFPPGGETFDAIENACRAAVEAGWMCARGKEGLRYGRVIDAGDETAGLSVDVVDMVDVAGPHHSHPAGEVCMVMPLTEDAKFDGTPRGWCVYPPGSSHSPTVTGGEALVLYMLPGGAIEFTR